MTGEVTVGQQMEAGTTFTLSLTFSLLLTSHGGEYTCQSTVGAGDVEITSSTNITAQSEWE